MKPLERLTHRVTFRTGIIVFAAMVVLALSSTSARRVGLAAIAASVVGVRSATVVAAAENNGTAIRPFRVNVPEADLTELRRRVLATRWPERETVADQSQGMPLAMIHETCALLGDRLRLAEGGSEAECAAAVPDDDRRTRHSFHPRSIS
jgi:hypothetical protein